MIAWLLSFGTKLKIWAGLAVAVLVAVGVAFVRGREAGKDVIRQQQDKARAKAIEDKRKSDDAVDQMGDADVDREYDRWVRRDR